MKINIALISPFQNAHSETFIQAHKQNLDANIFYYYNNISELENHGKLKLSEWTKLKRKIKIYLRLKQPSIWELSIIKSFLKHNIMKVYAEYGTTGVVILNICKKLHLPLIVHFHGFDASVHSILKDNETMYKQLFDYAEHIIVVSIIMKEKLISIGASPEKITYTPCAPNDKYFSYNPTFSENSFISVGRFVNKKAPYYTIFAFMNVLNKYPDAKLYFCGDGDLYESCINIAKYFKLTDNIYFLGSVSALNLKELYEKSIAFVQHSVTALDGDMEGTPVAILEASAAGLPVIATKHAGITDVILHEKTGLLIDEHDVNNMTKYMILLLDNKEYARELGKAGNNFILNNFSMNHHISIINNIIKKRKIVID